MIIKTTRLTVSAAFEADEVEEAAAPLRSMVLCLAPAASPAAALAPAAATPGMPLMGVEYTEIGVSRGRAYRAWRPERMGKA